MDWLKMYAFPKNIIEKDNLVQGEHQMSIIKFASKLKNIWFQAKCYISIKVQNMKLTKVVKQTIHQITLPVVDISNFIAHSNNYQNDCKHIAHYFNKYGLVVVKDPRVNQKQNDQFQELMVRYFTKRSQQYHQGLKDIDSSPQTHFQVGLTPQYKQKFQDYKKQKMSLKPPNHATTPLDFGFGSNWRFSWKLQQTKNVIPTDFPQMESILRSWAIHMKNGCLTVAEMLAIGLDIERNQFVDRMVNGAFMLSPTAVNLEKAKNGDVLVGFHRDFGMLTMHGKSRFPGLFSWLNTGEKFMVNVPQGHLLIQAGKQLQWITGGYIKAGFHQVIYSKQVDEAKQKAARQGKPLWRISSTMFCDCQEKVILSPHPKFMTQSSTTQYPPISARDQLKSQLNYLIQLQ